MKFFRLQRGLTVVFLTAGLQIWFAVPLHAETEQAADTASFRSLFFDQNERCFRCHGSSKYSYFNSSTGTEITDIMCTERMVSRQDFYTANHRSFACIDCHSAQYDTFPHPGELRMEEKYNCIDCHGYDEKYARFNFEGIEEEFHQSVHYQANPDAFTCWKCHDPHSYKINIRNSKIIKEAIAFDNNICLGCHSNFDRYSLLTEKEEINIIQQHDWLPNQGLHFSQVRCIECHARLNDSLMVAHRIMKKENAVRRCVECHSQNSLLMASLYKYQSRESRTQGGFLNAVILNDAFVIGANRNVVLNRISIYIVICAMVFLLIHLSLRIILKKKGKS